MKYETAVYAALNYARNYVPIRSGNLRYKFIKRTVNGIEVKITGFNYPDYINRHKFKISNPKVLGGPYTRDWEKRFCNAFAERLAKNLRR